jgi:hypothetical protein
MTTEPTFLINLGEVVRNCKLVSSQVSKDLRRMAPQDKDVQLLMTIPGIRYYAALLTKSEIGSIE